MVSLPQEHSKDQIASESHNSVPAPNCSWAEEQGCHHLFFWVSLLSAPTLSAALGEALGMLSQISTGFHPFASASAAPFA